MKHKLKQGSLVLMAALGLALTACLPAEAYIDYNGDGTVDADERLWREVTLYNQVRDAQQASTSHDCYSAIDKHWPGNKAWARKIVSRESGNNPRAQNRSSSAAGCFQMLALHNHRYAKVGCSASQKYNADCNVKAAYNLYQESGTSPWRATNY